MAVKRVENPGESHGMLAIELPRMCWSGWAPLNRPEIEPKVQAELLNELADCFSAKARELRAAAASADAGEAKRT